MTHKTRNALLALVVLVGALVAVYFLFPGLTLALAQRAELSAAGLEQRAIDVAGHHIEYLEGGRGEPLVLLHGFGADKSNWARVSRYLTPHFRVVAPDLPGFGESTRDPNASYAIPDQVERIHAIVHELGLESFHLGGNSMGGQISGTYASRYPDEVKSLWLLAPGGVASAKPSELATLLTKGVNPLSVDSLEGFDRLLDFAFVEKPFIPGPIKRHLAQLAVASHSFNEKVYRELHDPPVPLEPAVKGLSVPTLIVWGDHDRLLDVSGAEILGSLLPNARVVIMKNVGHVPMVERPKETAEDYLRFRQGAVRKNLRDP